MRSGLVGFSASPKRVVSRQVPDARDSRRPERIDALGPGHLPDRLGRVAGLPNDGGGPHPVADCVSNRLGEFVPSGLKRLLSIPHGRLRSHDRIKARVIGVGAGHNGIVPWPFDQIHYGGSWGYASTRHVLYCKTPNVLWQNRCEARALYLNPTTPALAETSR